MFRQIYMIKDITHAKDNKQPKQFNILQQEQRINFKFTKPGFKRLLIFDLDETLIHVKRSNLTNFEESDTNSFEPDVELPVLDPSTGIEIIASFSVRPYARRCLAYANRYFEVAIFTAGKQWFANPILDFLDPNGTLIQHRYFRPHTCELDDLDNGFLYVKDLDVLTAGEVTLDDILIVDNNIYSFAFNLQNGIPVNNYLGAKNDKSLL